MRTEFLLMLESLNVVQLLLLYEVYRLKIGLVYTMELVFYYS